MKPTRRIKHIWTCCDGCHAQHWWKYSGWWHYLLLSLWAWVCKGLPCDE